MSQTSPRLELPFIQPSQAQKHVTHNEALRQLDLIVQLTVVSTGATTPPAAPEQGEVHALGAAPVGVWSGQSDMLAAWLDNAWHYLNPAAGWRAWDKNEGQIKVWNGSSWADVPVDTQSIDGVGIATDFDDTNRLSVRSPASLLSHDGGSHQLKINKASQDDTASLVFQSNWTGHAEMGLSGDTGFSIKVSPDGGNWIDAVTVDPSTGTLSGAAVQDSATDTTAGRLMRADYGYGPGNLLGTVSQNTGTPTGSVIESGTTSNGDYVRFADGTQICTATLPATGCTNSEGALFASDEGTWFFPMAFVSSANIAVSGNGGTNTRFLGFDAPTDTQVSFKAMATVSDSATVKPTAIAVGRWY